MLTSTPKMSRSKRRFYKWPGQQAAKGNGGYWHKHQGPLWCRRSCIDFKIWLDLPFWSSVADFSQQFILIKMSLFILLHSIFFYKGEQFTTKLHVLNFAAFKMFPWVISLWKDTFGKLNQSRTHKQLITYVDLRYVTFWENCLAFYWIPGFWIQWRFSNLRLLWSLKECLKSVSLMTELNWRSLTLRSCI